MCQDRKIGRGPQAWLPIGESAGLGIFGIVARTEGAKVGKDPQASSPIGESARSFRNRGYWRRERISPSIFEHHGGKGTERPSERQEEKEMKGAQAVGSQSGLWRGGQQG